MAGRISQRDKEKHPRELVLEEMDVRNFEVLSFEEKAEQNGYKLMLYGEMDTCKGYAEYAFIEMIVHYASSRDMFNELAGESWFEDGSFALDISKNNIEIWQEGSSK